MTGRAVLGPLLESRAMCAGLAVAAVAHVGLTAAGLEGWPCPVRAAFGLPCPGCGLGRAGVLLLRGEVGASLHVHAFGGLMLGAIGGCAVAAVLPGEGRRRLARAVSVLEAWAPVVPVILSALLVYWLGRLAWEGSDFIQLVG